jgi:hypothetical protein
MALLTIRGRYNRTVTSKKGGIQFVVVAMDYFTKWAEMKALVNITAKCMEKVL